MQKNTHYTLIAFDWDGTLFDSTALIARCVQLAVEEAGGKRPSEAEALHVIGLNLHDALTRVAPDLPAAAYPDLARNYRRHFIAGQNELRLFEGIWPLLQDLRRCGYKLAIATGKSRSGLEATLQHAIDGVPLRQMFDATRTADETAGKPHPQMLLEIMEELGVGAHQTLMVGDTTHDLQMARNAQCDAAAVSFGAHPHEQLLACEPRFLSQTVAQLRSLLLRQT